MSQADALLERLLRGETVTPRLAYELTGSLACHSRIAELRERGYRIECRMRSGGGRRWGEYRLVGQLGLFNQVEAQCETCKILVCQTCCSGGHCTTTCF